MGVLVAKLDSTTVYQQSSRQGHGFSTAARQIEKINLAWSPIDPAQNCQQEKLPGKLIGRAVVLLTTLSIECQSVVKLYMVYILPFNQTAQREP